MTSGPTVRPPNLTSSCAIPPSVSVSQEPPALQRRTQNTTDSVEGAFGDDASVSVDIGLFVSDSVPPIPDSLIDRALWRRVVVGAWSSQSAIHNLEARTSPMGLSALASDTANLSTEILSIGDNMAEVLATEAGRARNAELNVTCRRACAIQVGAQIRWPRRRAGSARNISDEDSRLADIGAIRPGQAFYGEHFDRQRRRAPAKAPEVVHNIAPPGKYFLELFSGCERLSGAVLASGMRIAQPVDWRHGAGHDISSPRVQRTLLQWLRLGILWAVSIAVPCTFDSIACQARHKPDQADAREKMLQFVERFIEVAVEVGNHVILENLLLSCLWKRPRLRRLFDYK